MTLERDLQNVVKNFQKDIKRALSKKEVGQICAFAVDLIVKRTRRGFGVKQSGGNVTRLKALSSSYIKARQSARSRLSRFTSPSKSNLTFTGQMLSSISVVKTKQSRGQVACTIGASPNRRRDGKTNEEIAALVSIDRPFLNLGKTELKEVIKVFQDRLTKSLKRR